MDHTPLTDTATDGIDRLAKTFDHALDAGQAVTDRAATDLQDGLTYLRDKTTPMLEQARSTATETLGQAADMTRAGIEHAREAGERLSEDARALAASALRYIRTQPLKSMLMAAGAGATVVIALRLLAGPHARR